MENKRDIKVVILAAGNSTRMKSSKSKILHKILGREIINFTIDAVINAGISIEDIIIVAGENKDELEKILDKKINYVIQKQKLGTAHALLTAYELLKDKVCDTLVLVGDNPYITTKEIKNLIDFHRKKEADATLITAVFPKQLPPYGRIIRDEQDEITAIIEELDATPVQREIREVNASIYLFKNEIVLELLKKINNDNKKQEYYLTDIIGILKKNNKSVQGVIAKDYRISIGINDRWELQKAGNYFNLKLMKDLSLNSGVTFINPDTTTVEVDVKIGKDSVIYPSTYISKGTVIGENCKICPFVYLKENTIIPQNSKVEYKMVKNDNNS